MRNAASNVIPIPCRPVRRIAMTYVAIDGSNTTTYGMDGVTRSDAIRLRSAAIELAEWLQEIIDRD